MRGWKTKLGAFFKAIGGAGLAWFSMELPSIIDGAAATGTKTGAAISIGLTILGGALKDVGIGHKLDKNTQAIEDKS